MAKHFVVRLAAVTDLHMRVEVEASNPAQAVELAFQESADSPDWHLHDEGPEPYEGTVEAHVVEDEHGETIEEFPITTAIEYERAGENAALLREAVDAWPQFDADQQDADACAVNGGDLVEWFGAWRERARASLGGAPIPAPANTIADMLHKLATRTLDDGDNVPRDTAEEALRLLAGTASPANPLQDVMQALFDAVDAGVEYVEKYGELSEAPQDSGVWNVVEGMRAAREAAFKAGIRAPVIAAQA